MNVRTWNSVEEMLGECDEAAQAGRKHDGASRASFVGRAFTGWADVRQRANDRWPEGIAIIERMMEELRRRVGELPKPTSIKRRRKWDTEGDEVDNDRMRCGQEFWARCHREQVAGPQSVSIFAAVTTSAIRDPEEVLWRGAAAIVLADVLESLGYRVELFGVQLVYSAYGDCDEMLNAVCLKRVDQPMDSSTIVNGLSGWFYRTVYFQAYFIDERTPRGGLGSVRKLTHANPFVREHCTGSTPVVIDDLWNCSDAVNFAWGILSNFK